jgi:hypothetical protein
VYDGFAYVSMIGLSRHYRRELKNGSRLGDFLSTCRARSRRAVGRAWLVERNAMGVRTGGPEQPTESRLVRAHGFIEVRGMEAQSSEADAFFRRARASLCREPHAVSITCAEAHDLRIFFRPARRPPRPARRVLVLQR